MAGDMTQLKTLLARVADGNRLSQTEAEEAFDIMMSGNATPAQVGAFLMALRVRGETVDEIAAAARTMRAKALKIAAPEDAVEAVGTGGDASGSFNISTATAFVVAGAGLKVAKHGNRAFSSKSGAADVLTALGVNIECDMKLVEYAISKAGVGFMMAPRHHSAMRHVAGARVELGTRTIFNLLGPLSNPAGVRRQLVGVFARKWIGPLAETLGRLGSTRAWVVHGSDGLDEITTTGATYVAELDAGKVREFEITPEDAGLPRATSADLKGGTAQENAAAMHEVLGGKTGPLRDVVLMNSAALLLVAGAAPDLKAGVAKAAQSIDGGGAKRALDGLVEITNRSAA
ncbi:MAG: anthranilate phosphoribosyltransferase [Rhodospirillales bacterium]|nr:anthranilate phosphoribosyltransferase [Rhodospirillales bacterium]